MEPEYSDILKRINELQAENDAMHVWQSEMMNVMKQMLQQLQDQQNQIKNAQQYAYINRVRIESLPYEMRDEEFKSDIFIPHIMTKHETRRAVIDEKKSISRFGDGEFGVIAGVGRWNFQSASSVLADKLIKVLESEDDGILIGLPRRFYGNLENYTEEEADAVRVYMRPKVRRLHAAYLKPNKIYADALQHEIKTAEELIELKEIWNKRDCVFIEGEHTGMGVGNDLFDNCNSIERIIAPAENAIDKYDEIMSAALKKDRNKLVLIALGPTATALSFDLYKEGFQTVDIGHADLYYEKFVRGLEKIEDVSIPFKYCSWDEIGKRREIEKITDETYRQQITDVVC